MRDIKELIAKVERSPGWSAEITNGGHYKIRGPNGALVHCATTPSDWRAIANILAQLRRVGWDPVEQLKETKTTEQPKQKEIAVIQAAKQTQPKPFHERLQEVANLKTAEDRQTLADLIGVTWPALSMYLIGRSRPTREPYLKLVKMFPALAGSFDPSELRSQPMPFIKPNAKSRQQKKEAPPPPQAQSPASEEKEATTINVVVALAVFRATHKSAWLDLERILKSAATANVDAKTILLAANGVGEAM